MVVLDDVLSLACSYVQAGEEDREVLTRLCAAADARLRKSLRKGIAPEDCADSFICAAAMLAAADFSAVSAAFGARSFTAGPVSVSLTDEKVCKSLREQAGILMAPYCQDAFCFLEV